MNHTQLNSCSAAVVSSLRGGWKIIWMDLLDGVLVPSRAYTSSQSQRAKGSKSSKTDLEGPTCKPKPETKKPRKHEPMGRSGPRPPPHGWSWAL